MSTVPHIFECSICHRVFSGRFGISSEGRSIWRPVKHGQTTAEGRSKAGPCPGGDLEAIITDQAEFAKVKHRLPKTPLDAIEQSVAAADPARQGVLREIALASRLSFEDRFCEHVRIATQIYVAEELAGVLERVAQLRAVLWQCLEALESVDLAEGLPLRAARDAAREVLRKDEGKNG